MNITIITPENNIKKETDLVNELFRNGLERLHLRKPGNNADDNRKYIKGIDSRYHPKIAITNTFELFNEFELGGIHLNGTFRRDEDLSEKISYLSPSLISTSYHNWQKIVDNEFGFGYVLISPVFDSISKKEYKANIDPYGARKTKEKLAAQNKYCPAIIGLGGVGLKEITALHEYGFDGAAMLGSLWMSGNPVATFTRALEVSNAL